MAEPLIRVLVIDDQELIRTGMRGIIKAAGRGAEFRADDPVPHLAPGSHGLDQADLAQYGEVFGDCLPGDGQSPGEGRRRGVALAQDGEDAPPGLVAECTAHVHHGLVDQNAGVHELCSSRATSLSSSPSQPSRWSAMSPAGSLVCSKPDSMTVSWVPPGSRCCG